jgi:hypothetical protein
VAVKKPIVLSNGELEELLSTDTVAAAGSNTQVLFNDSGVANGSSGLTFDKVANSLSVSNSLAVSQSVSVPNVTGTAITVGNSTVNFVVNSTALLVGNSTTNGLVSSAQVKMQTAGVNGSFQSGGFTIQNSTTSVVAIPGRVNVGSNVAVLTTGVLVGNSTVNAVHTSTAFTVSNSTLAVVFGPGSVNVGSNASVSATDVRVGNSTANVFANSTAVSVGANSILGPASLFEGNSTVNATYGQTQVSIQNSTLTVLLGPAGVNVGANSYLDASRMFVGNSTVNAVLTQTSLAVQNSALSVILGPASLSVGANSTVEAARMFVGNSTVNAVLNSTAFTVSNSTGTGTLTPGALAVGNSTVNVSLSGANSVQQDGTWFFNGNGSFVQQASPTVNAALAVAYDHFTGNGSETTYTISQSANDTAVIVALNGVVQDESTYAVSGVTLTFSEAVPDGDSITTRVLYNVAGVPSNTAAAVNDQTVMSSLAYTSTNTDAQSIDAFDGLSYRSAEYFVSVTNSDDDYMVTKAVVLHNGSTAWITEFGTMWSNQSLVTLAVDVSGDNVRLRGTPAVADTTFKILRTAMVI